MDTTQRNFELIRKKVTQVSILSFPNFNKTFEVECDASNSKIGVVLSQEGNSIAFFSEKLNDSRNKYSTYEKEFYAIFHTLDHWSQYLIPNSFVLYSNNEALKFINSQQKLNKKHVK